VISVIIEGIELNVLPKSSYLFEKDLREFL